MNKFKSPASFIVAPHKAHKAAETIEEFIENKTADVIFKKSFEEIIIPPEKRRKNIESFKRSVIKMEHHKIWKLLNKSCVSNSVRKNWNEEND